MCQAPEMTRRPAFKGHKTQVGRLAASQAGELRASLGWANREEWNRFNDLLIEKTKELIMNFE